MYGLFNAASLTCDSYQAAVTNYGLLCEKNDFACAYIIDKQAQTQTHAIPPPPIYLCMHVATMYHC